MKAVFKIPIPIKKPRLHAILVRQATQLTKREKHVLIASTDVSVVTFNLNIQIQVKN